MNWKELERRMVEACSVVKLDLKRGRVLVPVAPFELKEAIKEMEIPEDVAKAEDGCDSDHWEIDEWAGEQVDLFTNWLHIKPLLSFIQGGDEVDIEMATKSSTAYLLCGADIGLGPSCIAAVEGWRRDDVLFQAVRDIIQENGKQYGVTLLSPCFPEETRNYLPGLLRREAIEDAYLGWFEWAVRNRWGFSPWLDLAGELLGMLRRTGSPDRPMAILARAFPTKEPDEDWDSWGNRLLAGMKATPAASKATLNEEAKRCLLQAWLDFTYVEDPQQDERPAKWTRSASRSPTAGALPATRRGAADKPRSASALRTEEKTEKEK